jgi:hypothetical protein
MTDLVIAARAKVSLHGAPNAAVQKAAHANQVCALFVWREPA